MLSSFKMPALEKGLNRLEEIMSFNIIYNHTLGFIVACRFAGLKSKRYQIIVSFSCTYMVYA